MNAEQWIFAARHAVIGTARSVDGSVVELDLRDVRLDPHHPWASFDARDSRDVFWVAQVDGSAPVGSQVAPTEFGDMGVWRHPHDPALPGLRVAVTPGALRHTLARISPEVDADHVEIVALQPLQRATVRIGRPGRAVFVKAVPPRRLARVVDNHRRARHDGVPSPTVLHVDHELGLVLLTEIPGSTLADHLESGQPIPSGAQVWDLIEALTAALGTHGDLHDRQILVDRHGHISGVVDLDDAGEGDLVDDLGRLVSHVAMRADTHPAERDRIDEFVQELVTTLANHVDAAALTASTRRSAERLQNLRQGTVHRSET